MGDTKTWSPGSRVPVGTRCREPVLLHQGKTQGRNSKDSSDVGHVGRKCRGARSQLLMQGGQLGWIKMEVSMAVMMMMLIMGEIKPFSSHLSPLDNLWSWAVLRPNNKSQFTSHFSLKLTVQNRNRIFDFVVSANKLSFILFFLTFYMNTWVVHISGVYCAIYTLSMNSVCTDQIQTPLLLLMLLYCEINEQLSIYGFWKWHCLWDG